jgi:hypothetical protein
VAVVRLPYWGRESLNRKPLFKALVKFPRSPVRRGTCTDQFVITYMLFYLNISKFVCKVLLMYNVGVK